MELHTEIHAGTGPYLLLVHGFLSSRAQFEPNLAALSEVVRPVVLELWGHGHSPAPEDHTLYHPDAYVDAFEGVRKRLGVEHWIICGQSLGAALTLRYALEYPQRVSAQIFTNSTSAFADAGWADGLRQTAASNGRAIREGGRAALEQMPFHPRHATRLPAAVRNALLRDSERLDPIGIAQAIEYTVPESSVRDRIQNNEVPTLLVCGARDKRFATYRSFAEDSMPALELVCLDAGHAVNLEASEAFDKAAVSFIQRQTSS